MKRFPALSIKNVLQPLHRLTAAADEQRIEAARRCARDAGKVVAGRARELVTLGGRNARGGATETRAGAHAYFDEYQRFPVPRDQVYFAETAWLR